MRWSIAVSLVVLAVGAAVPARATTVLRLPVEEMTRRADLVVRAEVRSVTVRLDDAGARPLSTIVDLRVTRVLKGQAAGPTLRLDLVGGATKTASVSIPGMPSFRAGDDVVLFLEKTSRGYIPAGLSQGKFLVRRAASGVVRAERETVNLSRVTRDVSGRLVHMEGPDPEDEIALDDLLRSIARGRLPKGGAR